jgi:hypothetical protein
MRRRRLCIESAGSDASSFTRTQEAARAEATVTPFRARAHNPDEGNKAVGQRRILGRLDLSEMRWQNQVADVP